MANLFLFLLSAREGKFDAHFGQAWSLLVVRNETAWQASYNDKQRHRRRSGLAKWVLNLHFLALVIFTHHCLANDDIPLPFEGLYESLGSIAKEKVAANQWREIPQDVQMLIVKDGNIIELQLLIEVHSTEGSNGPSKYTIDNKMWLVKKPEQPRHTKSGRVGFDVYKIDRSSNRFEDLGDGYCGTSECRYSYITAKPGRQQRYHSHISWQPQKAGTEFKQTGGLSVKREGEFEWLTYKTWENTFESKSQAP